MICIALVRKYLHELHQARGDQILFRVGLQLKSNLCAVSEGISAGVRIYFKCAFISRGAKDILQGVRVLGGLWWNRCDCDFIRDKETGSGHQNTRSSESH